MRSNIADWCECHEHTMTLIKAVVIIELCVIAALFGLLLGGILP